MGCDFHAFSMCAGMAFHSSRESGKKQTWPTNKTHFYMGWLQPAGAMATLEVHAKCDLFTQGTR